MMTKPQLKQPPTIGKAPIRTFRTFFLLPT
jgi:hypothetical protein